MTTGVTFRTQAAADRGRVARFVDRAGGQRFQPQLARQGGQGVVGLDQMAARLGQGADGRRRSAEGALAGNRRQIGVGPRRRQGAGEGGGVRQGAVDGGFSGVETGREGLADALSRLVFLP